MSNQATPKGDISTIREEYNLNLNQKKLQMLPTMMGPQVPQIPDKSNLAYSTNNLDKMSKFSDHNGSFYS
jgi:hypothetical protein